MSGSKWRCEIRTGNPREFICHGFGNKAEFRKVPGVAFRSSPLRKGSYSTEGTARSMSKASGSGGSLSKTPGSSSTVLPPAPLLGSFDIGNKSRMSTDTKELKWERRKKSGYAPSIRSGCTMALWANKDIGILFGGVKDDDQSEESLVSEFYNDLSVNIVLP